MPQDPRTWATGDYVSSSYLDYDLYAAGAGYPQVAQFVPNGIRWHSQPALYKCIMLGSGQTLAASGVWKNIFASGSQPEVIVDTAGFYGAHMDPTRVGTIQDVILSSGGGLPGQYGGGLYLVSGYVPLTVTTGGTNMSAGLTQGSTIPNTYGTQQKAIPGGTCTPFLLDLQQFGSNTYTLSGYSNNTGAATIQVSVDGSGTSPSFSALWVSGQVGFTTSGPAPTAAWTSASTVTSAGLNSGLRDVLRTMNFPPLFRGYDTAGVSVPNATNTTIGLNNFNADNYSGWSTPTYTVKQSGLYLVHGIVFFSNFSAQMMAGVSINGTDYWGPAMPSPSNNAQSATKTQIFSLNANDTISLRAWQNSGSAQTTNTTCQSRLVVIKVGTAGTPSTLPSVPDLSFRYTAGYQPDLSSLLNAHLANDLTFLTYQPYLMSYQTAATTGIAMGTPTKTIMQNNTGIVHGDNGDNYSGYNATTGVYTVQRTGWYMCVGEVFMSFPSLTTTPLYCFQMFPSPTGATSPSDGYQSAGATLANNAGGATGFGYYHLRAGDTIYPGIYTANSSATTTSTTVTGRNSHFEMVWVGE